MRLFGRFFRSRLGRRRPWSAAAGARRAVLRLGRNVRAVDVHRHLGARAAGRELDRDRDHLHVRRARGDRDRVPRRPPLATTSGGSHSSSSASGSSRSSSSPTSPPAAASCSASRSSSSRARSARSPRAPTRRSWPTSSRRRSTSRRTRPSASPRTSASRSVRRSAASSCSARTGTALFVGVAVMAGLAFLVGLRWLPQRRRVHARGSARARLVRRDPQDQAFLLFLVSGDARLPRLRLVRDRPADHGGRHVRALAVDVGLPRDRQPGPRHDLPAAADAARRAHPARSEARRRRCC